MKYDPNKHHPRSIRLPGYDYRVPGAYFITICSWQRECLFGELINDQMQLSPPMVKLFYSIGAFFPNVTQT